MRNGMRERSLARMEALVAHYANREGVLAVVAFGSNAQRERFDDSSDLDFLVLVTDAAKPELLRDVQTLGEIAPVDAVQVQYGDAVTLLFSDGVLCDFGIVTPQQLTTFPHGAGCVLWKHPHWTAADLSAREPERPSPEERATDALFHLYTGLMRVARGEEAAALYEVQVTAAQQVLALVQGEASDAFSPLRRAEKRVSGELLAALLPGYGHTKEAARAMLAQLAFAREWPLYRAVERLLDA